MRQQPSQESRSTVHESLVTAVSVGHSADGAVVLFAGTPHGVYRSQDTGEAWAHQDVHADVTTAVTSIAVSPRFADDKTVFVGTLNGCYRSMDGGVTYTCVLTGGSVTCVGMVPDRNVEDTDRDALAVLIGTEADGVLRTTDYGATWQDASAGLLDLSVVDLTCSPNSGADRTAFLATDSGVYRSRNGGHAWSEVDFALDVTVQCLRCSPQFEDDRTIYAGTADRGLWRSVDEGASWISLSGIEGRSINALAISRDGRRILAGTDTGLLDSDDAGETWRVLAKDLGPILTLATTEWGSGTVWIAGMWGRGVAVSEDASEDWRVRSL